MSYKKYNAKEFYEENYPKYANERMQTFIEYVEHYVKQFGEPDEFSIDEYETMMDDFVFDDVDDWMSEKFADKYDAYEDAKHEEARDKIMFRKEDM